MTTVQRLMRLLLAIFMLPGVALAATSDVGYVKVLYWPNRNLGFGHIALEVFFPDNHSEVGNIYISWARRNLKFVDEDIHQREPREVTLPIHGVRRFLPFMRWSLDGPYGDDYVKDYGASYNLLKNNCAHAALQGLKMLGFSIDVNDHRLALTPRRVFHVAQKLASHEERYAENNY